MSDAKSDDQSGHARRPTPADRRTTPPAQPTTPGSETQVTMRKRRYLCAVRPPAGGLQPMAAAMLQPMAAAAIMPPMTADALNNHLQGMEGADVVRRIKPKGVSDFAALSAGVAGAVSSTPEIIVADIDYERGEALRLQAASHPNLIVEEDKLLTHYGVEDTTRIAHNVASATLLPTAQPSVDVTLRVVGEDATPLANATVYVWGASTPAQGTTGADGQVQLTVYGGPIESIRAVYVKPAANYWEKFATRPALNEAAVNVVQLRPLTETFANFPATGIVGWGQRFMQLDQLGQTLTGQNIKVAIIDSGCDNTHPQLTRVQTGVDLTNNNDARSWTNDELSHGTHCAGVIGAASGTVQGIRGFAPEAELIPLKVFPGGRFSALIDALDECINRDIDVVNLSLGSEQPSELVARKVQEAIEHGVVLIVAAGNSGGPVQFPGALPGVVTVSAIGKLNEFPPDTYHAENILPGGIGDIFPAKFSCFGPQVKFSGPGVAIVSSVPGGGYAAWDGTSMAAPHITGIAALILAHHPVFQGRPKVRNAQRVAQLLQILQSVARPSVADVTRGGAGLPFAMAALGQPTVAAGPGVGAPLQPQPSAPGAPQSVIGGLLGGIGAPGFGGQLPYWSAGYGVPVDGNIAQQPAWAAAVGNLPIYQAILLAHLRAAGLV
jgi:subtilisin